MRKAAGTTDAGYEHDFLGRQLFVSAQALHCRKHPKIAATGTPTGPAAFIFFKAQLFPGTQKKVCSANRHDSILEIL
jgi:hypothetical protein